MDLATVCASDALIRFDALLADQQYASLTRKIYRHTIRRFQQYCADRNGPADAPPNDLIDEFLFDRFRDYKTRPWWYQQRRLAAKSAVRRFLRFCGVNIDHPKLDTAQSRLINEYEIYLRDVRGLAKWTMRHCLQWSTLFLQFVSPDPDQLAFDRMTVANLDAFVQLHARRLKRSTTGTMCVWLRSFFRFLFYKRLISTDLAQAVMRPRVYVHEGIPKALSNKEVRQVLGSIRRRKPHGRRDYAILLMLARYGLRGGEVVHLKLDDIHWREKYFWVRQRKSGSPYRLPLLPDVTAALITYLRRGRPRSASREVFLTLHPPYRPLAETGTLGNVCRARLIASGISRRQYIGSHAYRHALAVRLLRMGQPLKAIGDVLGHRSSESTAVYTKLGIEDLHQACLEVPA